MMDTDSIIRDYKRLRAAAVSVHSVLTDRLSPEDLDEAARVLGLGRLGRLEFETDEELPVLMDYAIYDVIRDGMNAIDRLLVEDRPAAGSEELALLGFMQDAEFAVIEVQEVIRGVGIRVTDLFLGDEMKVIDIGSSQTMEPGILLATRLFSPGTDWCMTTGAALPVNEEALMTLLGNPDHFDEQYGDEISPEDVSGLIIRACLQSGASHGIRYQSVVAAPEREQIEATLPIRAAAKIGRNEACPCGSGKKYKKCCGSSAPAKAGASWPRIAGS